MPPIDPPYGDDRAWTLVAQCVAAGPVSLGEVVGRLEAAWEDLGPQRSVSAYLQNLVRDGRIELVNDGCRWTVCAAAGQGCAACPRKGLLGRLGQWLGSVRQD